MIDAFVRSEIFFPQTFADVEKRDWGVFFVTPTIPDSHDGNHACVLSDRNDLAPVIEEIVEFYRDRGLEPRVNHMSAQGDARHLRQALGAAGFTFWEMDKMQVYVFRGPSRITPSSNVHVRQVESVDGQMLAVLTSMGGLRSGKVAERRAGHADSILFAGELDGEVASVALLEHPGEVGRVDDNPVAERIYVEAGFDKIEHTITGWGAWQASNR